MKKMISLLLALLLCCATALAESPNASLYVYEHDPRENPTAMRDIVENPDAVYGFSPSPAEESTLKEYVDAIDWTNTEQVTATRAQRQAYHDSMEELYDMIMTMVKEDRDIETIARTVSQRRNELRLEAYADDPEGLETVKKRNLDTYGSEFGPTPDSLYEKYGSWEMVLIKALGSNPGMDACLGFYDAYYDLYDLETESDTQSLANPWKDLTEEELRQVSGLFFTVPDGAEEIVYRRLENENLAEIQFILDGDEFIARVQPGELHGGELLNISGMYFDWEHEEEITVNGCYGTIGLAKTGSEDWIELCQWYDAASGVMYSLSVYTSDPDGLDLTAVTEGMFAPAEAPAAQELGEEYYAVLSGLEFGTAGAALKTAIAASQVCDFAAKHGLYNPDEEMLQADLLTAYIDMSEDDQAAFWAGFDAVQALLDDCLKDYEAKRPLFEDAGVVEIMDAVMYDPLNRLAWENLRDHTLTLGINEGVIVKTDPVAEDESGIDHQ